MDRWNESLTTSVALGKFKKVVIQQEIIGVFMAIHFIGAGQMSEAIIRALITNGTYDRQAISISDISAERVALLNERYMLDERSREETLPEADMIVIGIRPQDDLIGVTRLISELAAPNAIAVSIVAGVTIDRWNSLLEGPRGVVRVIPNTLTDTGLGYSAAVLNEYADIESVDGFINGFGKVVYIDEALIDAFTGVAVAGPNYIYYFYEAMVDAGVLAGLPRELVAKAVLENLAGAARMLELSGKHPRQLLDINNSPAGVGMHGLYELNNSDFAAGLQRSVLAAVKRTTALAGK